ncbi:MAG: gliding motility-associated protein GldE [Rikenellaceae bacterium]
MQFAPFDISSIYIVCTLVVLVILSYIISGSETALLSIIKSQSSSSHSDEMELSHYTAKLIKDPYRLAYSFLLIGNIINICVIVVTNATLNHLFLFSSQSLAITVKLIAICFTLLLVAIFIPKSAATFHSEKFTRATAPIVCFWVWVFSPLTWLLSKIGGRISPSVASNHENVSIEQLQNALEATQENTPSDDKKILTGIVTFIGKEVSEIMKPRVDVTAIEAASNFEEVMRTINTTTYSRIPIYQKNFDEIIGVLFAKDLLPHIDEGSDFEWHKLIRTPFFVPENKKINDLLEDFQAQRRHLAIIVDEYGGTLGIVTLEDILEEIVGDITDETDSAPDFYKQLSPTSYLFDGSTHLSDFGEVLTIDEEDIKDKRGNADTLAGLMMELKGEFFSEGDEVAFEDMTLRAEEVERYRITKVLVTRL